MQKIIGTSCAAILMSASALSADTLTWTGGAGTRDFTDPLNWEDGSGQPASPTASPTVGLGDELNIGVDARYDGPVVSTSIPGGRFERIDVSAEGLTINTVPIMPQLRIEDGATIRAQNFNMADMPGAMGRTIQTGGDFPVREMRTSASRSFSGGTSEYRLEGGYLSAVGAWLADNGDALFRQSDGQFDAGNFSLGSAAYATGSAGDGRVVAQGFGEYRMTGGVLNTGFLGAPPSETDPQLRRNGIGTWIGDGGPALFVLSGGEHNVLGGGDSWKYPLVVGGKAYNPNGGDVAGDQEVHKGEYRVQGGALNVSYDAVVGEGADSTYYDPGYGVMRQTGGEVNIGRDLILGGYGDMGSGEGRYLMGGDEASLIARDLIIGQMGANGVGSGLMGVSGGYAEVRDIYVNSASRSAGEPLDHPVNSLQVTGNDFQSGYVSARNVIVGGAGSASGDPNALLEVSGSGVLEAETIQVRDGGLLKGTGYVGATAGLSILSGGVLAPGLSPGMLTIGGDLFLGSGSELILEIAGYDWGAFDMLEIYGDLLAEAGASIRVEFLDGFMPEDGDVFSFFNVYGDASGFDDLLLSGEITVTLAGLSGPEITTLDLSSEGARFAVEPGGPVGAVPIPASLLLLASGVAAMGAMRLRRQARA